MIPQGFIDNLLSRLDIVDVVSRRVALKKTGANYQACCPFHKEKTPSFTVTPSKQFYHCFGCGAHGSAIGFVMEHDGLSFPDAVRELAGQAGLPMPDDGKQGDDRGWKLKRAMETAERAAQLYQEQLRFYKPAMDYLADRGVLPGTIEKFRIGFAPDAWHTLTGNKDYSWYALDDAGLSVKPEQKTRPYDYFRKRIMFSILNRRGEVIGFGGRLIGDGKPKYLNTPETMLFRKGRELFGAYQASSSIRSHDRVFVVEGYLDVAMLSQHGIENTVAPLGTATTADQLTLLLRMCDHVTFCFDGDDAGQKAAWRAAEGIVPLIGDGQLADFMFLPPEHDPDSFVRAHGKEGFLASASESMPLTSFIIEHIASSCDSKATEGRAALLDSARGIAAKFKAPALGMLFRKQLAAATGLSEGELAAVYGMPVEHGGPTGAVSGDVSLTSMKVMLLLMHDPLLASRVDALRIDALDESDKAAIKMLVDFLQVNTDAMLHEIPEALDSNYRGLARGLAVGAEMLAHDFDAVAELDGLARILERRARRKNEAH